MKYQHIILGGTGHVGTAVANNLIERKQSVMIIGKTPEKSAEWKDKGATYKVVDVLDSERLRELFGQGERLFILNPPAPPSSDTVQEEMKSVKSILNALKGLRPQKIVVASTYGAQKGDDIGDLGTLYELEQGLLKTHFPLAIIRSAYYMSNWSSALKLVKENGILPTLYPADFKLPMVAPKDIGNYAADLILNDTTGLHFVEGPARYSINDVARTFGSALQKPVIVETTARQDWVKTLEQTGFSLWAAEYMCNMTDIVLNGGYEITSPFHGSTSLEEYLRSII